MLRRLLVRCHHTAIDASRLEFTQRNNVIEKNLGQFYPSLSALPLSKNPVSIQQFLAKYSHVDADDPESSCSVNGRIKNIRFSGKKICFVDLYDNCGEKSLQLIINFKKVDSDDQESFESDLRFLKIGDYVEGIGYPGVSQRQKTLSLKCTQLPRILSCAQMPLPPRLSDSSKINQNRVVDYQVNGVQTLVLRHSIIRSIRKFLDNSQFVEVETPILSSQSNGAAAEPFTTRSTALPEGSNRLELRVAPELWLKRLVVGGLDRVYEIGKVFRNEGVDAVHNPEFTTLEFYKSFTSMEQLIALSEQLLKSILLDLRPLHSNEIIEALIAELQQTEWKFNRVEFIPTLSQELNFDLTTIDLNDPSALYAILPKDLGLPPNLSPQQILNKLASIYIEERYCNSLLPTLIYHHPAVMSPLAKTHPQDPTVTKRFEIFIRGREYINAYEEENCPQLQLAKFQQQNMANQLYKDKESLSVDQKYVDAMKWGMPPVGGFGLGIDRLCMLLLNKDRLEEVLSFGCLDDVNRQ